jgi:putative protein-disulfide isomerase
VQEQKVNSPAITNEADAAIEITVYTDPLCCWSWASEPHLETLQNKLGDHAKWRYRMGGLLPSWKNFHDEINSVSRPLQMGPVWMHAGQIANKPIQHQIWMKDPPASSYPACIAVKCAQLQSEIFGESLLKIFWHKCMTEGKNIAKQTVLNDAAKRLVTIYPEFDLKQYNEDYNNGNGITAFRSDLELVQYYRINRFPSIVIKTANQKPVIVRGYRNYNDLLNTLKIFVPGIIDQETL